jgi:dihydropteroate synthase
MHNRAEPFTRISWPNSWPTCGAALDRAMAAGVPTRQPDRRSRLRLRQDPGAQSAACASWPDSTHSAVPVLLGTSRKSTIGLILGGLPPEERLEGTLATTALGIAAGADIIRVHDVRANVRAARYRRRGHWRL